MKENNLILKKAGSRGYSSETITNADYADDLALLIITTTLTKSLLHSLEKAARGIGLYVNSDKTESMCFILDSTISTLDDKSLKLVGKFKFSVAISHLQKVMPTYTIDRLSIKWNSGKIKQKFFHYIAISVLLYDCTT